jgi:hypothetical protein
MSGILLPALLLTLLFEGSATAGQTADVAPPAPVLRTGDRVWVTMQTDDVIDGRVLSSTSSDFRLRSRTGELVIAFDAVRRIDTRDSLCNGARIGGIVGALCVAPTVSLSAPAGTTPFLFGSRPAPAISLRAQLAW